MPFACEVCGKAVRRPYDLRRHAVLHDPDPPRFFCPYPDCPRSAAGFLQKMNLKTHVNARHTKSRTFVCRVDGCGRTFWDGSARTRHERNAKQHRHLLGSGYPSSSALDQTTGRRGNDGECMTVGQSALGPTGQASRLTPEIKQEEMLWNMANPADPGPSHINALVSQDLAKLPPMSPTSVSSSFYPAQVGMEASTSSGAPFVQASDLDLDSSASTLSFPPSTPTSAFIPDPFYNLQDQEQGMNLNFSNPDPALGYPAIDINVWLASTQELLGLSGVSSRNGLDSSSGMGPVPSFSSKHEDGSSEGHSSSSTAPFDYDAWYANLFNG